MEFEYQTHQTVLNNLRELSVGNSPRKTHKEVEFLGRHPIETAEILCVNVVKHRI